MRPFVHENFLRAQFESLLKHGVPDTAAKLPRATDYSGQSPIFSDQIKGRVQEAHFEMTALSVGVQLERDAQAFYKKQADLAEDEEVKDLFMELARWESGHYHALLKQQKALRQSYFADNDFAPF